MLIKKYLWHSRRTLLPTAIAVMLLPVAFVIATHSFAANPSSGSVSPGSPASWTGVTGGAGLDPSTCVYGATCDRFTLNVNNPGGYNLKVRIQWLTIANDLDLYLCQGTESDPCATIVGQSAQGTTDFEEVNVANPASGTYYVVVVNFAGATTYSGQASLSQPPSPTPTPPPGSGAAPRFQNYVAPPNLGNDAGEPSIGVNWNTGRVMYIAGLQTLRVTFDDTTSPARATWEDRSYTTTSITSLDPILFTDHDTGRTFVSQLFVRTSLMAFTDNDGQSWTPSEGGSALMSAVDHQTVGGGAVAPGPIGPITSYPHAVYYCSQDVADASCALSRDGGLTFGPAVPIYSLLNCGGLHGHIKVARDGTAYVPNKSCAGSTGREQAVVVSEDNGTTWQVRSVPGSTAGNTDPSVGIATDGTIYLGMQSADGHPRIAVSHDKGRTWSAPYDVGAQLGIQNSVFPAVVAGDADRAAFAFIGTTTGGNYQDPNFRGVWYLYIASTYDGGNTWITVNATPNDPVQRGSICTAGTTCGNDRNLLDFIDATVDAQGRVLVAYADGCIGGCVNDWPNSYTAKATIVRQSGGRRMFAQYDPVEPSVPGAPLVTATRDDRGVHLSWPEPDNGGSPITEYRIYRATTSGGETLLTTTTSTAYDDRNIVNGTTYYYQVSAVNAVGEGPRSPEVSPVLVVPPDPCTPPGVLVSQDTSDGAPNIPANPAADIQGVYVAEPYLGDGVNRLVFTLKVGKANSAPPSSQWYIIWNRPVPDSTADRNYVAMKTDAAGQPSFEYGRVSPPNVNMATRLGAADSGSYDPATGTIVIAISNDKADNVGAGSDLPDLHARTFLLRPGADSQIVTQTTSSDYSPPGLYTLRGNAACRPASQPDLTITDIVASQNRPGLTHLTATVANIGTGPAENVVVRFVDGATPIANSTPVASIPAGGSAQVSIDWNTRGQNGQHVITAIADPANTIRESNEANNSAQRTITIRGNKVQNGSFEQSSGGSPSGWSGSQNTGYESNSAYASDGTHAVSATGNGGPASILNPAWTSAPIPVTPGQTYNLAMTVSTQGASSGPGLQVVYLDALGNVLSTVTAITTSIGGNTNLQQVLGQVTIPQGATQVRIKLLGFSPTDLSTRGTVWFDDVWMW